MYQNNPLDEKIDRKHSDSVKYGAGNRDPEREKLLPLWVADMDFRVPDPVIKALRDWTEHGIFGYGAAEENYYDAVCGWFRTHFHFDVDPRWIVTTPGVVFALSAAIRTFTEKGDAVLINRPVYYPFSNLIDGLKRRLINSPLQLKDGRYEIDFADVEEKIVSSGVRLYLLCSPHNPVGRVWTREELKKLGDICLKHDVLIVADEIHCDFVWSDHPHTVFASLGEPYHRRCILCTAPSKTFNLAGLNTSNIIIADDDLRRRFRKTVTDIGASAINVMGLTACRAAYESGSPPDPPGRHIPPVARHARSRSRRRGTGALHHTGRRSVAGQRQHVRPGGHGISADQHRLPASGYGTGSQTVARSGFIDPQINTPAQISFLSEIRLCRAYDAPARNHTS